jgi:hypothetical protein
MTDVGSGPTIVWSANGDAGDSTGRCGVCNEERDESHSWEECARVSLATMRARVAKLETKPKTWRDVEPIPLALVCPKCCAPHVDEGEWSSRPHRTHQCQKCMFEWRPCGLPTVGIDTDLAPGAYAELAALRAKNDDRESIVQRHIDRLRDIAPTECTPSMASGDECLNWIEADLKRLRSRVKELETLLAKATQFTAEIGASANVFKWEMFWFVVDANNEVHKFQTRAEALAAIGLRDPDAKKDGG